MIPQGLDAAIADEACDRRSVMASPHTVSGFRVRRTIIAGSRWITEKRVIDAAMCFCDWTPSVVISGCAAGADTLGEEWAAEKGIPVERFPADWKANGRAAGPIRNRQMAEVADALVALWDGESKGTEDMIKVATKKGLKVSVFQVKKKHLRCWWFSTEKMTVVAETEDDIISKASPIVRKFVGQHIKNWQTG